MSRAKITKVRVNSEGALALLKGPEVQADIARRTTAVEAALPSDRNEEWSSRTFVGFDRAVGIVGTGNAKAREAVADKPSVLVNALSAGR